MDIPHETLEFFARHSVHVFEMFFWNNQRVSAIDRMNVEKSKDAFIFIHFFCWNLSSYDFTKKTIMHDGRMLERKESGHLIDVNIFL